MNPADRHHLSITLATLQKQISQMRDAFDMLGITFCSQCGKPHHRSRPRGSFMYLRQQDGDGLVPVCMDDPEELSCFFAAIDTKYETIEGGTAKAIWVDLNGAIARWILDSGAYAKHHPMHGTATELMCGLSSVTTEDLAFSLLYWRNAKFGGVIAGETGRDLLRMCGWNPTDEEYLAVVARCNEYAKEHGHKDQARHFSAVASMTSNRRRTA